MKREGCEPWGPVGTVAVGNLSHSHGRMGGEWGLQEGRGGSAQSR